MDKIVKKIARTKEDVILVYEDNSCELVLSVDPEKWFIRPYGVKGDQRRTREQVINAYRNGKLIVPKEKHDAEIREMIKHQRRW